METVQTVQTAPRDGRLEVDPEWDLGPASLSSNEFWTSNPALAVTSGGRGHLAWGATRAEGAAYGPVVNHSN